jgi:hypothetical protein
MAKPPMKKTRGKKKLNHPAKKRFFSSKYSFVIYIVAFAVFALLLSFVNNPTGNVVTGHEVAQISGTSFISDFFTNWSAGSLDVTIAKYLFWIMLLMLITDVLGFVGFPSNGFLQFLLALVVSFLATAYITPNEVYVMLTSYSALGLTLGTIIPFMIMNFTSVMLAGAKRVKQMSSGRLMLIFMLWLFWTGFLIYRVIMFWITYGFAALATGGGIVLVIVLIVSVIIFIANKQYRGWLQRLSIEAKRNQARIEQAQRETAIKGQKAEESARRGGSEF